MKKLTMGLIALFTLSVALAGAQETERRYLSGRDAGNPVKWDFFCTAGQHSGVWTTALVPDVWETQGFGTYDYGHRTPEMKSAFPMASEQGQYRTTFSAPGAWKSQRVFIVFEGVMTDADVKINGKSAGPKHQGAYYRFKYEITPLLDFGLLSKNTLEVTVNKESADDSINRAERRGDYWNYGGIFRPVYLEAVPQQYIERVAIDAKADGSFNMNYVLGGKGQADGVSVTINDPQGKALVTTAVKADASGRITTKAPSPVSPWTAETPALYTAVVSLTQNGKTIHEIHQKFGFRTIEVKPRDGIYLNGVKIRLKGVDRHSFWPTTGRALSEAHQLEDVNLIKEMNMNAVRMSHYPPDEHFLDLCDQMGLYILDELGGWQKFYSTEAGTPLIRDMVIRDVNHPCILFWDNGNEGGWNNALNGEFAKWDPQQRNVLHPQQFFGDVSANHYPTYTALARLLEGGNIVMPTEFLHGLYDGGHGAGLEDYWNLMLKSPNAAGGFLWSFADEGVVRTDLNGAIDVQGNQAPDGILGPFHEKEGSFYTIKEVWSPVYVAHALPQKFDGALAVENRYAFTNLKQCAFAWELRTFGEKPGFKVAAKGKAASPDVAPGGKGTIKLDVTAEQMKSADALALKITDPFGRELRTWVWGLKTAGETAKAIVPPLSSYMAHPEKLALKSDAQSGALQGVTLGGKPFALTSGPIKNAKWTQLNSDWVQLDFAYDPAAVAAVATPAPANPPARAGRGATPAMAPVGVVGVAFNYPEEKMLQKTWLGEGPYRVWRNRRLGGTLGVWETAANKTETGFKDWVYPEFAGYFTGVRWMRIKTAEGTLTLVNPDDKAFVRVGTPAAPPQNLQSNTALVFPEGNLAVVRDLPPMGNKFHRAQETGPQATTPLQTEAYQGTVYLKFER